MSISKPVLSLTEFDYDLPDKFIAQQPKQQRGQSKLLCYKNGQIKHTHFSALDQLIPSQATLVFNNTKVIPARLYFKKETGADIELFLLEPVLPSSEMNLNLATIGQVVWKCMVGNAKKWKDGMALKGNIGDIEIIANWQNREEKLIQFNWNKAITFAELLDQLGKIPLPPYIKRKSDAQDEEAYQTVYASQPGAVAAPTAGLHFTEEMLGKLKGNKVNELEVTLHVGAGTFQPVAVDNVWEHHMHREFIEVNLAMLKLLQESEFNIAVGTTSLRTLESLYWFGMQVHHGQTDFELKQEYPYAHPSDDTFKAAINYLVNYCNQNNLEKITGYTELMIVPSYEIKSIKALITNFHMPQSTLIMLVCACIGNNWRNIYESAKEENYEFLSYGDSSILFLDD